jgi:hypothetical protein
VSRVYLNVLDERMKAVKEALRDGFGVAPVRVVQSSYEPIHFDETGALCGAQPNLGMDVHPGLKFSREACRRVRIFCGIFCGGSNALPARTARVVPPILRPAPAPASRW